MPLEIRTGCYRTRSGVIAFVTDIEVTQAELPFEGFFDGGRPEHRGHYWYANGHWTHPTVEGENDLVEWLGPLPDYLKIKPIAKFLPELEKNDA